jgi:cytochrome c oxidase cbb3-type subunit 3
MKSVKKITYFAAAMFLSLPFKMMSATADAGSNNTNVLSNPLFVTLLIIIAVLAIMIVVLANSLKSIISSDFMMEKIKKQKALSEKMLPFLILTLSLISFNSSAAEAAQKEASASIGGLEQSTFYFMVCTIGAELLVLGVLFNTFKKLLSIGEEKKKKAVAEAKTNVILKKLTDTVSIEEESSIMLDHDYDGIRELDNNLPPWWKYGFYLTILIAVIYLLNYHVLRTSPLQAEEYTQSVKKAEAEVAEFMKNSANNVDETTVKLLTSSSDIDSGKELFMANCAACHGRAGEGTVGPNLTDDYWLHGGGIKDIFKTIKYGWPDKGMKSWKEDFSPMQIAQLTSFLRTFKGTNPSKPKEKQGELYIETEAVADTLITKTDSAKVVTQILTGSIK